MAVHGAPSGSPGRVVEELRRVGVRNPMFVLDEADRLDEGSGTAAALLEAIAPAPGAAFRDRYVDVPFDLAEALFVATANSLGSVPAVLRETMTVIELPSYTDADKRVIATLMMVPIASPLPSAFVDANVAPFSVCSTMKKSSWAKGSVAPSSTIGTEMVFCVSPGWNVRVPAVRS